MSSSLAAMVTWISALGRGEPSTSEEREGVALAKSVLGEEGLNELLAFFAAQPADVLERERRGAVAACSWMARADRSVTPEEDRLLSEVISRSGLSFESQLALLASVAEPWPPERIAADLTQPGLRDLMLALAWRVAHTDGRIDPSEQKAYRALADAFGIDEARAEAIRGRAS